jgi:dipeptidyl-peptidase-4
MLRIALAVPFLLAPTLLAQPMKEIKLDTHYLRDHASTRGFMLGRPASPQPTPDGKSVLFLRAQPRKAKLSLFEYDVASGRTVELLTPDQILQGGSENLSAEEKARRERMRVSTSGFTSFKLNDDGSRVLVSLSGRLYVLDRSTRKTHELKTGAGALLDPKFSPDGTMVSYVRDHDVYVYHLATNKEARVTTGGSGILSHGVAEFVAQEEMGRFTGYWWSPDSKAIAFQETDNKSVEVWRVFDPINPAQEATPFFYPRPGKANAEVKLCVTSLDGGTRTWIVWDRAKYPYLATVRWPKDGPLLLAVQARDQSELLLLKADPATGATSPLHTERDKTWVNLRQEAPWWIGEKGFLWISEIDGGPQLEIRQANGRRSRVVVPPDQGLQGIADYDPENGGEVFYLASSDPTQSHVWRVNVRSDFEPMRLSTEEGMHAVSFAKNHQIFALTTRPRRGMPRTTIHKRDGTQIGQLPSVAEDPPFEPRVEYRRVGPGEGFYAAVIFPRDFDAKKKYPVMVDVYGGPHHIHVHAVQQRWLLDQWYADQGFFVVAFDGRGTPGRGRAWERAIYKKFGSVPLDDQVAGLKAVAEQFPNMDTSRVGIDGWSFGGYMAALAVMRRPDVFHVGVAGAPVCDWYDYDTHYTERYLGVPADENDPAYKEGSLLTYAQDLRRPLLVLHGTADDNVYFRHSLRIVDALFRAGKDFEMVPLSRLTHMVPDPEIMERLHARIAGFLKRHLGDPQPWK